VAADDTARRLLEEAQHVLPMVTQVLDGWHQDGTVWTEWDESVRISLGALMSRVDAYLAAQPKDEAPDCRDCHFPLGYVHSGGCLLGVGIVELSQCGKSTAQAEPPAQPLIQHEYLPCWAPCCHGVGDGCHFVTPPNKHRYPLRYCGEPRSRHVQPTEDPPPVVHPSESIPKR